MFDFGIVPTVLYFMFSILFVNLYLKVIKGSSHKPSLPTGIFTSMARVK